MNYLFFIFLKNKFDNLCSNEVLLYMYICVWFRNVIMVGKVCVVVGRVLSVVCNRV